MRKQRSPFQRFIMLCSLGLAACATGGMSSFPDDSTVHPAQAVPERFEPVAPVTRVAPADTVAGNGCTSPFRDTRDGTLLRMERAMAPRADYSVPAGRYGVGSNELLRLDCNTGIPIGIVRR